MIQTKQNYIEKFSSFTGSEKVPGILHTLWQRYAGWQQRERERRVIATMSERDFKDFGMTREQMEFQLESRWARALKRL